MIYPTKEIIESLFYYDENSNGLCYKNSSTRKTKGQRVGYTHSRGYRHVAIKRFVYKEHILIWILFNGNVESGFQIDHIDGIRDNNKIKNLRIGTGYDNQHNRGKNKNNTSGYKGVHLDGNRWAARIMNKRKAIQLGGFSTPKEAAIAYNKAAIELHGEFAKLNIL